MKLKLPDGGHLEIPQQVIGVFNNHRQTKSDEEEAGGLLLGRLIKETKDVVVDEATKPHFSDIRKKFWFFRNKEPAQKIVNKAWSDSDGTKIYLGEWHSHPEAFPMYSSQDIRNWKNIGKKAIYEQNFLFFIIVGTVDIGVWILSGGEIKKLEIE